MSDVLFLTWRDADSTKPTTHKVQEGAKRFRTNRGQAANVCLVNPIDAQTLPPDLDGVVIHARNYVQRDTFYLGAECEPLESSHA